MPHVLLLGLLYIAIALLVDSAYVMTATAVSRRFLASERLQRPTARASAATYVALGLAAALGRSSADPLTFSQSSATSWPGSVPRTSAP